MQFCGCVIHVTPIHLTAPDLSSCPPWMLSATSYPRGTEPHHIQEEQVTKTAHRACFQSLKIWSSMGQHTAKWDHQSMLWAETFPLLSYPNCPVCSPTTIPFLSASGLGQCISTKWKSCGAKAASEQYPSLKLLSQNKSTYFQQSYFSAIPSTQTCSQKRFPSCGVEEVASTPSYL